MAIIYYPNRVYKKNTPAIDRELVKRDPIKQTGRKNILTSGLKLIVSANSDWQLDAVGFTFSNALVKNYSAWIMEGRKVVENLNDYMWIQLNSTIPQRIVLDEDFYRGSELAAHLQTKLDANTAFAAEGVTFTVAYDEATGLFTITPSAGTIRYLNVNISQTLTTRDSICGHLFGFNADSAFAAAISSDTEVFGLNTERPIINETASANTSDYDDTIHTLSVDNALRLRSNTGVNVDIDYTVLYEELV